MTKAGLSLFTASLVRRRAELMQFLARKVGVQEAQDLAQEAFLRALSENEREEVSNPAALLQRIAANLALDHLRAQNRSKLRFVDGEATDEIASPEPSAFARLVAKEEMQLLLSAVQELPPRCREVFIMRRVEDLHQEEIARRLGISRNMVEKHLRVALRRLQGVTEP